MTTSSLNSNSLTGPSDIIAALPGILGFYPSESTVILGLYESNNTQSGAILGPVMRADLINTGHLLPVLCGLPNTDCIAYYAVVISRIPNSQLVEETFDLLYTFTNEQGVELIDTCWHVSEIAVGTPYTIVFGPSPAALAASQIGEEWISGTVSCVASSPSMKPLLDNGALPELTREDTFRFFDPRNYDENGSARHRQKVSQARAMRKGFELSARISTSDPAALEMLTEGCTLLHGAAARPLIQSSSGVAVEDIVADRDDLVTLASMLVSSHARDCMIIDALTSPLPAASALLAIAQEFTGIIRANALSLWAVIAVDKGLGSWAIAALTSAQVEIPGHNLSSILIEMLHHGLQSELVETAKTGCTAVWAEIDPACAA